MKLELNAENIKELVNSELNVALGEPAWSKYDKDGGMAVDSSLETITTLVDDTVKYTDKLTITGKFEEVRFDKRTPEEVKTEAEAEKARVQEQADQLIGKIDEVIAVVEPEISKSKN